MEPPITPRAMPAAVVPSSLEAVNRLRRSKHPGAGCLVWDWEPGPGSPRQRNIGLCRDPIEQKAYYAFHGSGLGGC